MICPDTSVWIAALRQSEGSKGQALAALIRRDAVLVPVPVRIEMLAGAARRISGGSHLAPDRNVARPNPGGGPAVRAFRPADRRYRRGK